MRATSPGHAPRGCGKGECDRGPRRGLLDGRLLFAFGENFLDERGELVSRRADLFEGARLGEGADQDARHARRGADDVCGLDAARAAVDDADERQGDRKREHEGGGDARETELHWYLMSVETLLSATLPGQVTARSVGGEGHTNERSASESKTNVAPIAACRPPWK